MSDSMIIEEIQNSFAWVPASPPVEEDDSFAWVPASPVEEDDSFAWVPASPQDEDDSFAWVPASPVEEDDSFSRVPASPVDEDDSFAWVPASPVEEELRDYFSRVLAPTQEEIAREAHFSPMIISTPSPFSLQGRGGAYRLRPSKD